MILTPRLFVSHSHEDDDFCLRLIADLRANLGEEAVWYDTSGGLHGGDAWWDRIVAEITERPLFLVVLSPNASTSKWVPQEMAIAFRQYVELGKQLLPVRLADSPRREDWRGIQEFDFTHNEDPAHYAFALAELLHAIDKNAPQPVISATPLSNTAVAPERPLSANERLARETHTAYGHELWSDVLDKTQILVERNAMTPVLWRERASAAFAIGNNNGGLDVIKQALRKGVDDSDTLLAYVRFVAKAGDDNQTVEILTRAFALASLDDTATRLAILDELVAALARLERQTLFIADSDYVRGIRGEYVRRVNDARRMAPNDLHWALREVEMLLCTQRYDEALMAVSALPISKDVISALPAWQAAISSAAEGPWDGRNWLSYRGLFDAATIAGVDPSILARWRFKFPHFVPLFTLSGYNPYSGMTSIVWSPDSARLAISSTDGTRVWDAASGRLFGILSARGRLSWALDGKRIAIAVQETTVWDTTNGHLLNTLTSPESTGTRRSLFGGQSKSTHAYWRIWDVTWSSDGKRLITTVTTADDSRFTTVQVWDTVSGQLLIALPVPHETRVRACSPDGASVVLRLTKSASSDKYAVTVWETGNGRLLALAEGSSHATAAWSPDGTRLAAANADGVQVWDVATWHTSVRLPDLTEGDVVWSPDSARLAVDNSRIIETASGQQLATLAGNKYISEGGLHHLSWSADGKRLVGSKGRLSISMSDFALPARLAPAIWDAASGEEIPTSLPGYEQVVLMAWSPDGTRLAVSDANGATIWGEE